MPTVVAISAGLAILGVFIQIGRASRGRKGMAAWALRFLPLWFLCTAINLYAGVTHAGYSVSQEAPLTLFVFAVPAVVAFVIWQKLH